VEEERVNKELLNGAASNRNRTVLFAFQQLTYAELFTVMYVVRLKIISPANLGGYWDSSGVGMQTVDTPESLFK
jgi:hypothetical protein